MRRWPKFRTMIAASLDTLEHTGASCRALMKAKDGRPKELCPMCLAMGPLEAALELIDLSERVRRMGAETEMALREDAALRLELGLDSPIASTPEGATTEPKSSQWRGCYPSCGDAADRAAAAIRAEVIDECSRAVCNYVGRCNPNRCPCHLVRDLALGARPL